MKIFLMVLMVNVALVSCTKKMGFNNQLLPDINVNNGQDGQYSIYATKASGINQLACTNITQWNDPFEVFKLEEYAAENLPKAFRGVFHADDYIYNPDKTDFVCTINHYQCNDMNQNNSQPKIFLPGDITVYDASFDLNAAFYGCDITQVCPHFANRHYCYEPSQKRLIHSSYFITSF